MHTTIGSLLEAQPPYGGFLLQVAGDHQHNIALGQIRQVAARRQTDLHGQFAAGHMRIERLLSARLSGKFTQVEQIFITKPPTGDSQQFFACLAEFLCHQVEGFFPTGGRQFAAAPHQGLRQPLCRAIGVAVAQTALITNPDFIDALMLARHHPLDDPIAARGCFAPHVERQVAAHRAVRTDRSRGAQFPGASTEAEICRG